MKEMYYVKKRIEVAFAHSLCLNYESKCQRLHGHNGIVTVYCCSEELDENGMVVDPSKSERRAVEVGRNDADYIEVLSGLSEGEVVLIQNNASSILAMMSGRRG